MSLCVNSLFVTDVSTELTDSITRVIHKSNSTWTALKLEDGTKP